jgi:hypothetical protein
VTARRIVGPEELYALSSSSNMASGILSPENMIFEDKKQNFPSTYHQQH